MTHLSIMLTFPIALNLDARYIKRQELKYDFHVLNTFTTWDRVLRHMSLLPIDVQVIFCTYELSINMNPSFKPTSVSGF